jgi:histidinol-phosphate aminotransferase
VLVPRVEHRYDLAALLDAITPRTKLVAICNPNNPTGTMSTTAELDEYFANVPEHVLTVIDQAYFEYIDRDDYPDAVERYLKAGKRVAVLRTFSKIYGLAGLRVGYAVTSPEVATSMAKVRRAFDVSTAAQEAALASIGDDAELARRRTLNAEGLARLTEILREHGFDPVPSVANFVFADTGTDANDLFQRLLREGVIVRPLAGFGAPTAIRVSVGTPDELTALSAALGRVLTRA